MFSNLILPFCIRNDIFLPDSDPKIWENLVWSFSASTGLGSFLTQVVSAVGCYGLGCFGLILGWVIGRLTKPAAASLLSMHKRLQLRLISLTSCKVADLLQRFSRSWRTVPDKLPTRRRSIASRFFMNILALKSSATSLWLIGDRLGITRDMVSFQQIPICKL